MPTQPSGEMWKSCTSVIGLVVWKGGAVPAVEQDRGEAERDQHRHHHEERVAGRVGEVEDELRRDDPDHLHDHVERQGLAAGLVGGGVVEPALGDDVDAGEAEADDEAQQHPDPDLGGGGVEDEGGRDHRAEGGEDPDVADAGDHRRGAARRRGGSRRSRRSSPATWWRRRSPRWRRGCRGACPAGRCRAGAAACRGGAPRRSSGRRACRRFPDPARIVARFVMAETVRRRPDREGISHREAEATNRRRRRSGSAGRWRGHRSRGCARRPSGPRPA